MELYKEILVELLSKEGVQITITGMPKNVSQFVENTCYQTLQQIKAIIQDDSLEDPECFMRIEEIICQLEAIGSNGGFRHDFG